MRYRHRVLAVLGLILAVVPGAGIAATAAASATPVKIVGCNGKTVYKPTMFVLACGDGGSELTATHWTSWGANGAKGTTKLGLNLCSPNCASSGMSFFPHSTVRLSAPQSSKQGMVFTKLVVNYTLHGKAQTLSLALLK
jgi:hypothetical protein